MTERLTSYLVLGLYTTAIYLMVRPSSNGPEAIKGWFNGMTQLATIATDI